MVFFVFDGACNVTMVLVDESTEQRAGHRLFIGDHEIQIQFKIYVASFRNEYVTKATAIENSTPNFGFFSPLPLQNRV